MASKTVTRSIAIRFNLVQVCPSLRAAVLFTPSFNVFSGYLYVCPGQSFISKASSQTLFFFRSGERERTTAKAKREMKKETKRKDTFYANVWY